MMINRKLIINSEDVSTESELRNAIKNDMIINIVSDIYLEASIEIYNITSLQLNGNGYIIDAQQKCRCMSIRDSSLISIHNLSISNGTATVLMLNFISRYIYI